MDKVKVLVVEDDPGTAKVIEKTLKNFGYIVSAVVSFGEKVSDEIRKEKPDIVLMDVQLKGKMDGIEAGEEIHSCFDIPVIYLTAYADEKMLKRAKITEPFGYILKPFKSKELHANILMALYKSKMEKELKKYKEHLEELVKERTAELTEAQKRLKILDETKSDFLKLISHELRSPLFGILGTIELQFDEKDDESREELKEIFKASKKRLITIIEEALLLTKIEVSKDKFPLSTNSICKILEFATRPTTDFSRSQKVLIGPVPDCDETVLCDFELLTKAFTAIIETAVKFSSKGKEVSLSCNVMDGEISIGIRADGRAVPEKFVDKFFEVFSTSGTIVPGDIGLGPPLARRIIALFNGTVTLKNQDPPGVLFIIKLKVVAKSR